MKFVPAIALTALALVTQPAMARPLQCAPYAREHSAIDLHGNAATWWGQAEGSYARGNTPATGSVLVFKATGAMPVGHVAVVSKIVDDRHVVLNHANWSRPGMIEKSAMAEDVSAKGDWSSVRVWYAPTQSLGLRASPTFGFIYAPGAEAGTLATETTKPSDTFLTAFADLPKQG
ncbi:CHAP domain-containing protein [Novosphingobium kaempferiae]|uniref:CHAP domain-containing protein n=1 Tax=Novosphingobium kaempferiae TaxID=2896849 RepID=UPI001E486C9D|nr:CHAP domain-containing protein [Novosphingobium kaempferiae]